MFKLVVLSTLLVVVAAKPGYFHSTHLAALPATISHSSRSEVHPSPLVAAVHAVPAVGALHALPAAVSHSSRVDIHQAALLAAPVVASVHAAPVVAAVHAAPILHHHGHHGAYSVHPY